MTIWMAGLLFTGCGYDRFGDYDPGGRTAPEPTLPISSLRVKYWNPAIGIPDDAVVGGVVTSCDREGNFYRTLVIEDQTGAVEIMAGPYDLHAAYPVGRRVSLRLKGLAIGMEGNVVQAGFEPYAWSSRRTDYIGDRTMLGNYLYRTEESAQPVAAGVAVPDMLATMCGRLVRVGGLHLAGATGSDTGLPPSGLTWATPSASDLFPPTDGYRKFKTPAGDSLLVVVSGYARFAGEPIPSGEHSITGILSYGVAPGASGRAMYILRIRSLEDVSR